MKLIQVVCEGGPYDGTHESRLEHGKVFQPANSFVASTFTMAQNGKVGSQFRYCSYFAFANAQPSVNKGDPTRTAEISITFTNSFRKMTQASFA